MRRQQLEGIYRLTFVTVRPTHLGLRIDLLPPWHRLGAQPMRIIDGSAVYEGSGSRLDLEVDFAPPLPIMLWRNVSRLLTMPVL